VSKTLGKGYFTLDKYFIGKGFFAEYFFGHSVKKNTRQIKNQKNKNKTAKKLNYRNNSPTLPIPIILPIALSFFTIILNQIYMFYKW
jgi:hypothetical protein